MGQDAAHGVGRTVGQAGRLRDEAGADTAAVAWIGYAAPGWAQAPFPTRARAGGRSLAADLRALSTGRTVDGGDAPHITVVGHSYGSTVVGAAATSDRLAADDVVLLGSPGVLVQHVDELGLPRGRVYVGEAPFDPIADMGVFGADPGDAEFGAVRIGADPGPDVPWRERLSGGDHSHYFDRDSASLRNVARVVAGRSRAARRPVPGGGAMTWVERAEVAQRTLVESFWDRRRGLYRVSPGRRLLPTPQWHYWWQAHALDAAVDAVARAPDRATRDRVEAHVAGVLRRNGGHIPNDYYDDMAWMALALLRADEVVGVPTDRAGQRPVGRDPRRLGRTHGGVVWRRDDTYTNTPANAPSAILAARLHRRHGAAGDLAWARRIADWQRATLVDPDTGIVWDGIHPGTDPGPSRELYTYNQGTVVGAEVELFLLDRRQRPPGAGPADRRRRARPLRRPPDRTAPGRGRRRRRPVQGHPGPLSRRAGPRGPRPGPTRSPAVSSPCSGATARRWRRPATGRSAPTGPGPTDGDRSLSTHLSAVLLLEALAAADRPDQGGGERGG